MSARRRGRGVSVATVLAVLLNAAPAIAQDAGMPELDAGPPSAIIPKPPADQDSIQVPSGGRPLVVSRFESIPRPLQSALERVNCNVTEPLLAKNPVLIFRPADGRRVMAVAPCFGVTPGSRAFLFERSMEQEPTPMTFPVAAPTGGFSASAQPGLMTWEPQTMTLTAWRGSEHCPSREIRHTYRQGGGDLNGFALSRVEHRQLRCTTPEADWQMLWQSSAWNLQP